MKFLPRGLENFLMGFLMGLILLSMGFCLLGPVILAFVFDSGTWLWLYCLTVPIFTGIMCVLD